MKKNNSRLWLLAATLSGCLAAYLLIQGYMLFNYHDFRYGLCAAASGILFVFGYCVCMFLFFRKPPLVVQQPPSETWKRFRKWNTLQIFLAGCVGVGLAVYLCRYAGGLFWIFFTGITGLILVFAIIGRRKVNQSRPITESQRQFRDTLMNIALRLKEKEFLSLPSTDPANPFSQIRAVARGRRDTYGVLAFFAALIPVPIILNRGNILHGILTLILFSAGIFIIETVGFTLSGRAFYPWRSMLEQGDAKDAFLALVSYCESCSQKWQFPDIAVQMYGVLALSYQDYDEEALALLHSIKMNKRRSIHAYFLYHEAIFLEYLKKKDELIFVLGKLHEAIPKSVKKIRPRAEKYYYLLSNMVNRNYEPVLALKAQQPPNELTRHMWDKLIRDAEEQVFGTFNNVNNYQQQG